MNEQITISHRKFILWPGLLLLLALSACLRQQETITNPESDEDYELITLLPRDAIPAIDNPPILAAAEAIAGPLAGQQLQRLKSTIVFWFGWKDFYPETRVYGVDAENN
jgi:hypothetical protein